jgi:hypothetical protein
MCCKHDQFTGQGQDPLPYNGLDDFSVVASTPDLVGIFLPS